MEIKHNRATYRLRKVPANTVVHTPTEEEANELLAILYENGYKRFGPYSENNSSHYDEYRWKTCYNLRNGKLIDFEERDFHEEGGNAILTLTEFKERYLCDTCTDDCSSQRKPSAGDKVRIIHDDSVNPAYVGIVDEIGDIGYHIQLKNTDSNWSENVLEPYTEPETKDETKEETKELNLCELLKGHEGEYFYVPICGTEIEIKKIHDTFIVFNLDKEEGCTIECDCKGQQHIGTIDDCGKFSVISYPNGHCMVFPSRALYEQYPLDPYTAWMKWQEKQNKYLLRFVYRRGR